MAAIPPAQVRPVRHISCQTGSPVARSDNASKKSEIFFPPETKSVFVFDLRADHAAIPLNNARCRTKTKNILINEFKMPLQHLILPEIREIQMVIHWYGYHH